MTKSFAEFYHQETKYSPEGLSKNQKHIDWSKQPVPFKDYKKGKKVELGKYVARTKQREEDLLPTAENESLAKLSKLLYYTNGITALVPYATPLLLRAAPSAGGLYPTEIYVVTNGYTGLEDGIYNFQVRNQSLLEFWDKSIWEKLKKACFDNGSFDNSNIAIIYTGVFYRSAWRYQDRAYRRILLDTGHAIGNTILYAPFVGKYCNTIGAFNDDELSELLWLDKKEEGILAVVTLSNEQLEKDPNASLPSLISKDISPKDELLLNFHNSTKIKSFDETKFLKNYKEKASVQNKLSFTFGESLPHEVINWENELSEVILNRRSTRAFRPEALSKEELGKILSFTYHSDMYEEQGFDSKPQYFTSDMIDTYVAVTDVEGLEDGCYYYSVSKKELRQIRFKNFREELYYLCLGQELGRDASVVVFHTINLPEAIQKYGERAYRYLHLDAGILGQRLNLACLKIDLGVSGIGGFFDDQVNELLGIPENQAVLYITTIGKPFVK